VHPPERGVDAGVEPGRCRGQRAGARRAGSVCPSRARRRPAASRSRPVAVGCRDRAAIRHRQASSRVPRRSSSWPMATNPARSAGTARGGPERRPRVADRRVRERLRASLRGGHVRVPGRVSSCR
jgi:hypothetical protein